MPNEPLPSNQSDPSSRDSRGSPVGGGPGPGEAVLQFLVQPVGLEAEQVGPRPLIQVVLARTVALVSWTDGAGEAVRVPVAEESVWFFPARTAFSAHWHRATPIIRLTLKPGFMDTVLPDGGGEPRIVRLADLTRMDWTVHEIISGLQHSIRIGDTPDLPEATALLLAERILKRMFGPESCCNPSSLTDERFHALTDFIEENITFKFTRAFLAETDGSSLFHFARMFKARTGLTPRQYIDRRRCFRARIVIGQGKRLADAAAEVGFFDQPEMTNKFNEVFGCPPGTFSPRISADRTPDQEGGGGSR